MTEQPIVYHFEWDPVKARKNAAKHEGITFKLATTVFRDPWMLTVYDETHSIEQERWVTIGQAANGQYLVVSHTFAELGPNELAVRIISARTADKDEIRDYEETPR